MNNTIEETMKEYYRKILPHWVRKLIRYVIDYVFLIFGIPYMLILNYSVPTRIARLNTERIGHLVLDLESFLRRSKNQDRIKIFFISYLPISNHYLTKKWSEIVHVVDIREHRLFGYMLRVLFKYNLFSISVDHHGGEYNEWNLEEPVFSLSDSEKKIGENKLREMGIGRDEWYVCIFARDSAYLNNYPGIKITEERKIGNKEHDYRDADIDNLVLAVKYILNRGGWVIRLGQIVEKEMTFKHPRVIDYPFTKWRSEFMDIYLQYRAKFVLSSAISGATDVVTLFNTPYCGVNMPYNLNVPYKNAIHIPKKIICSGKYVSLKEWIDLVEKEGLDRSYSSTSFFKKHNFENIENSPEEILELTKEMFERLDGNFIESDDDRMRQERYLELYKNYTHFRDCKNPIGKKFLQDNPWYLE